MTENVFTAMAEQVRAALVALYPELPADILARVQVEPPRDAAHGDMATNAALVIAKPARLPPAKIAAALVEKLGALPMVENAEVAGPGFVNLRLREAYLAGQIALLLRVGEAYG
ncbi:MAG: arginine--tRNA ligase, partial [Alphaproteobacteria bacterium]|nr:arginine--tRNA ligase [Alphaproteobacteria bacterium]